MNLKTFFKQLFCGEGNENVNKGEFSAKPKSEHPMLAPNEYRHDGNLSDQLALLGAILGDIVGSSH